MEQSFIGVMEQQSTSTKRSFFLFSILLFMLAVPAGGLSLFFQHRFAGWVQLMSLLGIGGIYALVSYIRFQRLPGLNFFGFACIFSLCLFLALSILYFFKEQFQFLLVLPLSFAFLLPVAVMESWLAFDFLPEVETEKQVWYYYEDPSFNPSFLYIENIPVNLKIVIDEKNAAQIKGSIPVALKLSRASSQLMLTNDPLKKGLGTFYNPGMQPYGWVFYTKKMRKPRYLDPEETVGGNEIKPNTTIYAERIDV